MKREDLHKGIKEKFLFVGNQGTGKTYSPVRIAKLYLIHNKKVKYIDPEGGAQKEIEKVMDDLTDEQLDNLELVQTTNHDTFLKHMVGWTEEGSSEIQGINYDLKVVDGIAVEMEQHIVKLIQKFLKQGYYEAGGKIVQIKDPDTFLFPWNAYANVYAGIKQALVVMLDHNYDLVCTSHEFKGGSESQKALEQSVFAKFDSVIRLKRNDDTGLPIWTASVLKNRGRERPDKSGELDSVTPLLTYFIKKFGMDVKDTLKRLGIEEVQQ